MIAVVSFLFALLLVGVAVREVVRARAGGGRWWFGVYQGGVCLGRADGNGRMLRWSDVESVVYRATKYKSGVRHILKINPVGGDPRSMVDDLFSGAASVSLTAAEAHAGFLAARLLERLQADGSCAVTNPVQLTLTPAALRASGKEYRWVDLDGVQRGMGLGDRVEVLGRSGPVLTFSPGYGADSRKRAVCVAMQRLVDGVARRS